MNKVSDYTAADIRIPSDAEIIARQPWVRAGELADQHGVPVEWVRRGLEACDRAGVPDGYFIARYLAREPSVALDARVDAAMREIAIEDRDSRWPMPTRGKA